MGVGERMACEGGEWGWWWFGEGRGMEAGGWEAEGRVMTTKTNYGKKELKGIQEEDSS